MHRIIGQQAANKLNVKSTLSSNLDARDMRQQWSDVLHADPRGRPGMAGKPPRAPISFP